MEEGADDLDLHPLPERQVADWLVDEVAEVEQLDELVARLREVRLPQPHATEPDARGDA